jgi:hypothetical protein
MPKRSPTAYNFLTMDTVLRKEITDAHPDWPNHKIMSEFGRLWTCYTPEQKKPYNELAKKAKEDFQSTPTNTEINTETNTEEDVKVIMVKKKAKSAFMFYLYDETIRESVKKEHQDLKPKELTSYISKMWNELTKEDKKPWEDLSLKEKQEYETNPVYQEKKVKSKKTPPTELTIERTHQLELMVEDLKKQVNELKALLQEKSKVE